MTTELRQRDLWPFWLIIAGLVAVFVLQIARGPLTESEMQELRAGIEKQPLVLDSSLSVSGQTVSLELFVRSSTGVDAAAVLGDIFLRSAIAAMPDARRPVKGVGMVCFGKYFEVGPTEYTYTVSVRDRTRLIVSGRKMTADTWISFAVPGKRARFAVRMPEGYTWPNPDAPLELPLN